MKEPSGNGYVPIIAQAIEEMKAEWGDTFSLEQINLAELERRTGISRGKLRRLKKNGFQDSRRNGDRRCSYGAEVSASGVEVGLSRYPTGRRPRY